MAKKKYWISYGNFGNVYDLYWTDSPEMEACLPEDAERITRKEAIAKCVEERWRRNFDPAFSGYADILIYPAVKLPGDEPFDFPLFNPDCIHDRYIVVPW